MSATMLRTSAARTIPRSFTSLQAPSARTSALNHVLRASLKTSARPARASRILAVTAFRSTPKALIRYQHIAANYDIAKAEKAYHDKILKPIDPDHISAGSSTRHVTNEMAQPTRSADDEDVDMMAGIRSDFVGSLQGQLLGLG